MQIIAKNKIRLVLAWAIGFILYMVAAILTADLYGIPACFCQPAIAFVFGGVSVGLAYLLRVPIKLLNLDPCSQQMRIFNFVLLSVGIVLLLFAQQLGWSSAIYDSAIGEYFIGPNPIAVIAGYFMVIFSIINW